MAENLMTNLEKATVLTLADLIDYAPGKVVSKTFAQRPNAGMTLLAFDAGEGLSTHAAGGDALAQVLEGTACITIDGVEHTLQAGNAIVMPVGIPHAVKAVTKFKMLLTLIR